MRFFIQYGLILSILLPTLTQATENKERSGKVTLSANSGYIIVTIYDENMNSCANRYYFKPETDYNRAMLSMLLSAQMTGTGVWVNGSGECREEYPFNQAYKLENMTLYSGDS
ncbi:hypothetical protein C1S86_23875 [Vibrio parahaemolyticus]|uniref:hypothetical protein n=1 Tax=Vibrio parahaemolyticus TaxID=670 RepID=UPI0009948394|nr:hypothetical protein [Vibrio parahaemolyticus]OOQ67967.1 hypothetical protein BSR61_21750 [Vibrio parahaemolyticus]PMT74102.1 hypothetical protein C1S97_24180 [Vibrio parahaemolyticus]PMT79187.1 hypothetical protein C1S86_23875 [Vibrio parahaemolyticus]